MEKFYSNGKLLLTAEYVVIDGATALAIPSRYGQTLKVSSLNEPKIIWRSLDETNNTWFEGDIKIADIKSSVTSEDIVLNRLLQILNSAKELNPNFLNNQGYKIETHLDFPKYWGLGTSSTLINNIANWANIDAYKLLELTFGGSGYDIACAQYDSPITYQLLHNKSIKQEVNEIDFNPNFSEYLYFVYLNKKQDSREGIEQYKKNKRNINLEISEISAITKDIINCNDLESFNKLILVHENIISSIIKETPLKKRLFNDFDGAIKSLGAWGGDFILVSSKENPSAYFKGKGLNTIIPFEQMVIKK